MKKLPQHAIDDIKRNYSENWALAMLDPERMDKCLTFIEKYKEFKFSYETVFFSPKGFLLYKNGEDERVFTIANDVFESVPVSKKDAEGNWKEWLKTAKLIKKLA